MAKCMESENVDERIITMKKRNRKDEVEFIKEKLKKSGYPLENYVSSYIASDTSWHVYTNAYFLDKDTREGRELDIKAICHYGRPETPATISDFELTLLIECKRMLGNAWIFFKTPFQPYSKISKVGLCDFLKTNDFGIVSKRETHFTKTELTATGYSEVIVNEKQSNKRTDNIWKTIIKLIKATCQEMELGLLEMERYLEDIREDQPLMPFEEDPFEVISVFYPVIVFEGNMYEATFGEEITLERRKYVELFVDYKSGNYKGTFLVDVISKDYFPKYFEEVNKDFEVFDKRAVKYSKDYRKTIVKAVKSYLEKTRS